MSAEFIEEISGVPGRLIVLTGRFNERLLDVVPQKHGGFAWHFLRGAGDIERVTPLEQTAEDGSKVLTVDARRVLKYARARIEDESRTLNEPQSIRTFGDNEDFLLIKRKK